MRKMKKKKIGIRSEKSTRNFVVNTKKNPKEECKMFLTRSKRKESLENAQQRRICIVQHACVYKILYFDKLLE